MKAFESGPRTPPPAPEEAYELEDFKDNEELYKLLVRIPADLRRVHMERIAHLKDEDAIGHLYAFHERRDEALRESFVSDDGLKVYFEKHKEAIWNALETHVFTDTENLLGAGTTARIKRLEMGEFEEQESDLPELAIKYLVSPTEKTLSVSGEHDLIAELEQLQKIEAAEIKALGNESYIRVPHPYFYYRKQKIQCYGMELIDGINLERGMSNQYDPELREELRTILQAMDRTELMKQVDVFFDTIYTICLHGDVKPRNLMVSRDGHFYVIDFGQSVLSTNITDKQLDASEELKEAEKQNAKDTIAYFFDALFSDAE
jgi:serine/threonine protein kinase